MKITAEQQKIIDRYSQLGKIGKESILEKIPLKERRYKCHTCHHIVDQIPCPGCGEVHVRIMCPLDHCSCGHALTGTLGYCPLCGEPVCPECLCHDVVQVSRVTGYLAEVGGFNRGKRAELLDRHRYDIPFGRKI